MRIVIDISEYDKEWIGNAYGIPQDINIKIAEAIINAEPCQPEPCEDAVSRQKLKDGFTEMCNLICPYTKKQQHVMCGSCLLGTAFDVLEATQSVTPKQRTGKWIDVDVMGMPAQACDQCNTFYPLAYTGGGHHFCPNCGAKMEVNNESN